MIDGSSPDAAAPILKLDAAGFRYRGGQVALDDVSLSVGAGEAVGVVGQSGAGKSTLLRLLLGLDRPTTGSVRFDGSALDPRDKARVRGFRASVQAVFQDPYSSLDPRQRVGRIVAEPLRSLRLASAEQAVSRAADALEAVGLPPEAASRYPHEFSGGQRQRIAIARAIVPNPRLLLADEPVSALDMSTRIQIIELLAELRASNGLALVMVSHDLGTVAALCERTVVLRDGRVVEAGSTAQVLHRPAEAYTRQLVAAIPRLPR
ncbi:peptide ABC transporter ATP-binding protein [Plantibacter sp. Leaf171]|uniref:ABC transporter ATP-binding protein n=1 Tax=unclassified Plantibacter TaxID=2624265 RepID=UPI0006FADC68|nr:MULTISPECIES: ABC transporter ATP-binding protein [unclassified Plantibacter]KQM14948.1 peptide ABC transporter ATP-binding protein [Plantibacter sp. Leaf1]KQQ51009.1 peptide ABC transporter ATP-binding protein [Plantibacter sp. Leaf314]KQR58091.1 peptide ABC transporter ATP-binding protein [Plantibacter sp. Leaf171]